MKSLKEQPKSSRNKKSHSFFNPSPFFKPNVIQAKLTVGQTGDKYEREADQMADKVVNQLSNPPSVRPQINGAPSIQQKCAACNEKEGPTVMRKANNNGGIAPVGLSNQLNKSKGEGRHLSSNTNQEMSSAFGTDFSKVRVHTGSHAIQMNQDLNAKAFTHGANVYFNRGQYNPKSTEGKRLLAHELTHVVQQGSQQNTIQRQDAAPTADSGLPARKPVATLPNEEKKPFCETETDITTKFKKFVADVPTILGSNQSLSTQDRTRMISLANFSLKSEGGMDLDNYKIVSCTKINSSLTRGKKEHAEAYVDESNKKVGLSTSIAGLMDTFRSNKNPETLASFMATISHEKRHVQLGSSMNVDIKNLKHQSTSNVEQASYRAEEILTVAEEIAITRATLGSSHVVSKYTFGRIHRHWNILKGLVTPKEQARLRALIFSQLNTRYGTADCSNSITVGVAHAMDHGIWYHCDNDGKVYGKVPSGITLCEKGGRHRVCGPPKKNDKEL